MPPRLASCQRFHYKFCWSGLDVSCKNFCPGLKTDAQNESMQSICLGKHMHTCLKGKRIFKIRFINVIIFINCIMLYSPKCVSSMLHIIF